MTPTINRLVVVGASLAGLRAVEAARKAGFEGTVTLIGAERHLPYDRPPLSKEFLEPGHDAPESTTFRSSDHFRDDLNVHLLLDEPATALDPAQGVVRTVARAVPYDAAVIATGSAPRRLPGTDALAGVHTLRTVDDAREIRAALDQGARTVVIGAGFIGSEVASNARKRGLPVTIVEALSTPLVRATGRAMGAAISSLHERNGTVLRCGVRVERLQGDDRVERVVLADGSALPADLVVVGVGITPNTDWLADSGARLDNGVVCDERLWTGIPGVYAAGDVANWPNAVLGERQRMENWTAAAEQGTTAARNAIGSEGAKEYGTVPYCWSDWYNSRIQFVGSPHADEVRVVDGDPHRRDEPPQWTALYRRGDRLIGALTVNRKSEAMKYRAQIRKNGTWPDALAFAEQRKDRLLTKARRQAWR